MGCEKRLAPTDDGVVGCLLVRLRVVGLAIVGFAVGTRVVGLAVKGFVVSTRVIGLAVRFDVGVLVSGLTSKYSIFTINTYPLMPIPKIPSMTNNPGPMNAPCLSRL